MYPKNQFFILLTLPFLSLYSCSNSNSYSGIIFVEAELVPLSTVDASILQEIRYSGTHNFIGRTVDGYLDLQDVLIQPSAAEALKKAQDEFLSQKLTLLIFDAYRPQIAVDHFVEWSLNPDDTLMKVVFYPDIEKPELFEQGYIARESSHTTGYTVDLTLVDLQSGLELDMGSPFDYFGIVSHHGAFGLTPEQEKNRLILRSTLEHYGFSAYEKEWWHYRFKPNEE